jgi:hypothetical protein
VCPGWKSNVQRVIKKRKNTTFWQSLTRDISQTNEPITESFTELKIKICSMSVTKIFEIEQIEKIVTLGGIFEIPTEISPKPRIGGAKIFYGLMGHYNWSLPLKFHNDPMHRKSTGAGGQKIFNRK